MKKDDALKILYHCASRYRENLAVSNLLFVFGSIENVEYFETLFLPQNFMHLTGIEVVNDSIRSINFYNQCLDKRLKLSCFELSKDGTTALKLSVLPQLMEMHRTAKRVLAVFKKRRSERSYSLCTYLAKGIALDSIEWHESLISKLSVRF